MHDAHMNVAGRSRQPRKPREIQDSGTIFRRTGRTGAGRRLARHKNLVILRTLSKAWGLAGLRVGYAMADPEVILAIHAVAPPFPLPGVALAAGLAALKRPEAVAARVALNGVERERLATGIRAAGFEVAQSGANFVWLPVGTNAEALNAHLARFGIASRCFALQRRYNASRCSSSSDCATHSIENAA